MSNRTIRAGLAALAAALALALAGCADMAGIEAQSAMRDAQAMGLPSQGEAAFALSAEWWRAFGDEQLDGLVAQALAGNPTLKLAQARLARAQAAMDAAGAALRPQVNGALDLTRQRYTENGMVPPPIAGSVRNTGTLQLSAGWELDFFGRNQAALDAALGSTRAAQADAQAARVLLASNVARAYLQLARANDQLGVAKRTLAQREQVLALVQDRVRAGLDTQLELRQSEGALPEARLQMEAMSEQAELAQHALAALTGRGNRTPVSVQPSLAALNTAAMPVQLPADLLGQRPDVVAARWRVEAAGHDVKNAKAQFYPNINLVTFAGLSSMGLGRLLEAGSAQWGVGPALRLPLFDAGRLRANLRGKTADLDAAVESYNATVLDAIRDAADQIASGQSIERQQGEQRAAQDSAEGAYQIAVQRYQAGLGTYLHVLAAETAVLSQRRLAVDLTARALDTQVGLMRAFGGGYRDDTVASPSGRDPLVNAGAPRLASQ